MNFANDYEIHRWQQRYGSQNGMPVLGKAADNLDALATWANRNSDGWHSWPKPCRAANRLITLLQDADKRERDSWSSGRMDDTTQADLTKALAPIKAFLTRQGVAHTDVLL